MDEDITFGLPNQADAFEEIAKSDQRINVTIESRRYGKITTLVNGFDDGVDLKDVAKKLKEGLACGGTIKDHTIELQGNHQKKVKALLVKMGFAEDSIMD